MNSRPTDGELAILNVLWKLGPSTVREIHQALYPNGEVNYNTSLKLLQIMQEKGLTTRDDTNRQHVYTAKRPKEATQRHILKDLLGRAFGGDTQSLVMRALEAQTTSNEELAAIEKLLKAARKARK